jgi:hypothetical protein
VSVHRVIAILLAVVLVPSLAMATGYRCSGDGAVRASCCCPAESSHDRTPPTDTFVDSACCCEVIQAAPVSQRVIAHATPKTPSQLAAVATAPQPVAPPLRTAQREARPRWRGGPPDPLFVRHCSLLL